MSLKKKSVLRKLARIMKTRLASKKMGQSLMIRKSMNKISRERSLLEKSKRKKEKIVARKT